MAAASVPNTLAELLEVSSKCKEKGNEHFRTGEFDEALKEYSNAIVHLQTHRQASAILQQDSDVEPILAQESAIIRMARNSVSRIGAEEDDLSPVKLFAVAMMKRLFCNRAACHLRLRKWSKAGDEAQHAQILWPTWLKPRFRWAEALLSEGCDKSQKGSKDSLRLALIHVNRARQSSVVCEPGTEKQEDDEDIFIITSDEATQLADLQTRVVQAALAAQAEDCQTFTARCQNEYEFGVPQASSQCSAQDALIYEAIAMLERDVYRSSPDFQAHFEAFAFPTVFFTGAGMWDAEESHPVRFESHRQLLLRRLGGNASAAAWEAWAVGMSERIKEGLVAKLASSPESGASTLRN